MLSAEGHSGGACIQKIPRVVHLGSKEVTVTDTQQMKITRRAYELWQQAGEPKDRDEEFYLQAKREFDEAPDTAITASSPPVPSQ